MIFLAFFLAFFTSLNAYGEGEFRSFIEYKDDEKLLHYDFERLRLMSTEKNDKVLQEALAQLEELKNGYDVVRSPLKLENFSNDASENGWHKTSEKVTAIVSICEGEFRNIPKCQDEINSIKSFIILSGMNAEGKEIVMSFFNSYLDELDVLLRLDEKFIDSFNQKIIKINSKYFSKPLPEIKVKLTPKQEGSANYFLAEFYKMTRLLHVKEAAYVLIGLISVIFFGIYIVREKRKRKLRKTYSHIFHVAKVAGVRVRLFGALDTKGHKAYSKIDKGLMECVVCLRSSLGESFREVHLRFNSTKKTLNVEVFYFMEKSVTLTSLIKSQDEKMNDKFRKIERIVDSVNGEIFYANHFAQGEFGKTSLSIKIPHSTYC